MGFKKERRQRLAERRALDRIRELSVTLAETTNAYRGLEASHHDHVSVVALTRAVNVVADALNVAVRDLDHICIREAKGDE